MVAIAACTGPAVTATEGRCDPSSTSVPKALSSTTRLVQTVTMYARKAGRASNATTVWWGYSSVDGEQNKPIAVDGSLTLYAPPGKLIDLSLIYIDITTTGDGVEWIGMA